MVGKAQRTLDMRIVIPFYNNYDKGIFLDDLVKDYNSGVPYPELVEKYGISDGTIIKILKEHNVPQRERIKTRHAFSYKKIKTKKCLNDIVKDKELYKLNACYCDYFAKNVDSLSCTLIEEKTSFSKYNHTVAALQLVLGEIILTKNTELLVRDKIIFAHKLGKNDDSFNPFNFIDDIKEHLDISTVILEEEFSNVRNES